MLYLDIETNKSKLGGGVERVAVIINHIQAGGYGHASIILVGLNGKGLFLSYAASENSGNNVLSCPGKWDGLYIDSEFTQELTNTGQSNIQSLSLFNKVILPYMEKTPHRSDYHEKYEFHVPTSYRSNYHERYDIITVDLTSDQGLGMLTEACKLVNTPNPQYHLVNANCVNMVRKILKGGIKECNTTTHDPIKKLLKRIPNRSLPSLTCICQKLEQQREEPGRSI